MELHTRATPELLSMMRMMTSGLDLSRNTLLWTLQLSCHWAFLLEVIQDHKVYTTVPLVEETLGAGTLLRSTPTFVWTLVFSLKVSTKKLPLDSGNSNCSPKAPKKAGDEIWVARYMLQRLTESYGYYIEYHPKPIKGDWNGSGMHANFSNNLLRTCGSKGVYEKVCEAFRPVTKEHIAVYGEYNDERLTGKHETASISDFSYGVSDRGASIRIPIMTVERGWKGWLEDRRPASNADPYKVAAVIVKTVKSAKV